MSNSPFADHPMFGFDIIHADPPWGFDNWSEKGEDRNPNQHYDTMPWDQIAALPVGEGYAMGTGYYTRANPEICLLGVTGKMPRLDAGVRQLVVEPRREHSRKPDRIADDIVRLFGDRPRIELFARTARPGWAAWGNQVDKFGDER